MGASRVVVTGLGTISPLGLDTKITWDNLLSGVSGIGPIQSFDASKFNTRIAAEVTNFDPSNYLDKKEVRRVDRFTQFALAATQEATNQSGLTSSETIAERTAVLIGSGVGGISTLSQEFETLMEKGPTRISPFLMPMMLIDMAAGQVSIQIGAKGPNYSIVTACASGSDAIGQGFELILRGETDVAVCGGTEAPICPISIAGFNACSALSRRNEAPTEASRPFDAARDGFVMGEGSGILVLERLEHALNRGATPLVELIGYGATSDAYHITQPSDFGEGGARAMTIALAKAGINPSQVDYINAHGTSTPLNDKCETQAIKTVFGEEAFKIPISSTKSMTGHLLGAAGALEAIISVLSIVHGVVPPTINLQNPDPECDLNYTPWIPRRGPVDVALSNALGFGGHNSTLIFQKFTS